MKEKLNCTLEPGEDQNAEFEENFKSGDAGILFDEKNRFSFYYQLNPDFDFPKDFNRAAFREFLRLSKMRSGSDPKKTLKSIGLMRKGRMTNAGVLFFCRNVRKFFKNATVRVFLYMGSSENSILESKEFKADLISNFNSVIEYLKEKLNTEYVIEGTYRKNVLELPETALKDALLNAFSHRDYRSDFNIQVHIYWNRVEIVNAGGLPKEFRIQDLGRKRFHENSLMCGLRMRMGMAEKADPGIKRIRKAIREKGLDVYFEVDDCFKVIFWRDFETTRNLPRSYLEEEQKIIEQVKKNPKITRRELAEELGIAEYLVKYQLNKLKKDGMIERVSLDKN